VQGDNSSLHGDFEDVGHVPKVVHFEPLKVATKWCTLTGRRQLGQGEWGTGATEVAPIREFLCERGFDKRGTGFKVTSEAVSYALQLKLNIWNRGGKRNGELRIRRRTARSAANAL